MKLLTFEYVEPHAKRFWSKVDTSGECWEWLAYRNEDGYGIFGIGSYPYRASRISWVLANGEISEKHFVLHKCDNPGCIRPKHLFLGDQKVNMQDMWAKGRGKGSPPNFKGSSNKLAKLKEEDVIELRKLSKKFGGNLSTWKLAEKFNISQGNVRRILSREMWKHV